MRLSVFSFLVDSVNEIAFKNLVEDYLKFHYPDAENNFSLTLNRHRLVIVFYDFNWVWSRVSSFVDDVLRFASCNNILVVCESVNF